MTLAEEVLDVARAVKQMERERILRKFREFAQSLIDMSIDWDEEHASVYREFSDGILRVCEECEE